MSSYITKKKQKTSEFVDRLASVCFGENSSQQALYLFFYMLIPYVDTISEKLVAINIITIN